MSYLKEIVRKAAEYDALIEGFKTPKFRKPTPPPKPNPKYTPPPTVKKPCVYSTPCGWCTKWDKKCDHKIGHKKDKDLRDIKSGKGLTSVCVFREPWKSIVP